ncbi:MAG TPA: endonuclease/exonuclease/phosphatase family protein [Verrucomicrobiae bacterium]|nr:endonuclease/exonuclease/phosphatase family protein [Verrucomicrobiae bacterium]
MLQGTGKARGGIVLTIIIFFTCHQLLHGGVLLNEEFSYPDAALTAASAIWQTHSGAPGQAVVSSGRLVLNGFNTEDVNAALAGGPFASGDSTNRFYSSFRLRVTAPPGSAGGYVAHFKGNSATAICGRIWIFSPAASPGKIRIGLSSASGSAPAAVWPFELNLNADYVVVTRLVNSNAATKLWIDPISEADFHVVVSEPADSFNVAAYAFRQAAGIGSIEIDDLRVGTRFIDVLPAAPNLYAPLVLDGPANQLVLQGSPTVLEVRAQADPPPSFQWFRDGFLLAGAQGSTLTLPRAEFADSGFYHVQVSNVIDAAFTAPVSLNVRVAAPAAFSLLNYNLHGNGVLNWTTNSPQVRAIGRIVQFLNPDILALQEIPVTNNGTAQMEHFVKAFRAGFHLATNSSDDGSIRSAIISRYPILAARSWLHGASLEPYGVPNETLKRDLFEAEIAVPGLPEPLHVFTVHLKSGQDTAAARQRTGETAAISNFFATTFRATHPMAPYVLTGDFNEDLMRPPPSRLGSVERLVNPGTGLHLTTPLEISGGSELTFSTQSPNGFTRRYDYILPSSLLWSNVVSSELFRSDVLDVLPQNLYWTDSRVASDHLPVLIRFANPFRRQPFLRITRTRIGIDLSFSSVPGQRYHVEQSANLVNWNMVSEVTAEQVETTMPVHPQESSGFLRVGIGPQ